MNVVRKKCTAVGCENGYVTLFVSRKPCETCKGTGEIVENEGGQVQMTNCTSVPPSGSPWGLSWIPMDLTKKDGV